MIQMDNMANILVIRKGVCQNRLVMNLIHSLTKAQIKGSFSLWLVHIPMHLNTDADSLSHGSIKEVISRHLNWIFLPFILLNDFQLLMALRSVDV